VSETAASAPPEETGPAEPVVPTVGPPLVILLVGVLCVVLSIALLVADAGAAGNIAGYLLAALGPILAVGLFRKSDLTRRISPYYVPVDLISFLVPAMLVLGTIAVIAHTWQIANRVAS